MQSYTKFANEILFHAQLIESFSNIITLQKRRGSSLASSGGMYFLYML